MTPLGSGQAEVPGCSGFAQADLQVSAEGTGRISVNNNDIYGVRIVNVGSANVRLAYDTPVYPASLTVGLS